ncbi:efflux RND transporter periplasmic adaptor subunit [bacterium]|nr:efflux RND transporter periplasmic adaptor subunit [bacterium]
MWKKIVIGMCIILAAAGCGKKEERGKIRRAVPVTVVPVVRKSLSEPVLTSGYLTSETEAKLAFKTGGIIDRLYVEEGERVRKGALLAGLKLDEIQAMVTQARNGYEKARRDYERAMNLFRDSVATLSQIQDAETGLAVARANQDIAEFNLAHSKITAPSDGRILKKFAEENELIGPGFPAFLFGTEGSEWAVKVGVADRDAVRLAAGDSASVSFDAFSGLRFPASVRTLAGATDPMSGTFEIELAVKRDGQAFVNGLMADAELFPSARRDFYVIPAEALAEVDGGTGWVYAVAPDSTAKKIPVAIGFLTDSRVMVESGLESCGSIITEGAAYCSDGVPVRVRP